MFVPHSPDPDDLAEVGAGGLGIADRLPAEFHPRESSTVQQSRAPVRKLCGFAESARCTPVTSCPASAVRAAATAAA